MEKELFKEALEKISSWDNIMLVCHIRPDGDTLGSASAICRFFSGKRILIGCDSEIPARYSYLFGDIEKPVNYADYLKIENTIEHVMSVDVPSLELCGAFAPVVCERCELKIDHHSAGDDFGSLRLIDPDAAAAGEIIYDMLFENGKKDNISAGCAEALYTAISTDTGCFKFTNTTAGTLRRAAELIELGADNSALNNILFESRTPAETAAIKVAYSSLGFFLEGEGAYIVVTADDIAKFGIDDEALSVVNGIPRAIEGVRVGFSVKQQSENKFKISVRSDGSVNCSDICVSLGGGGHIGAAGATIEADSPDAALSVMIRLITDYVKNN